MTDGNSYILVKMEPANAEMLDRQLACELGYNRRIEAFGCNLDENTGSLVYAVPKGDGIQEYVNCVGGKIIG